MEFTPTLLWSQSKENIEIEINLPNISSQNLKSEDNIFHFECLSLNKKYSICFELNKDINGHNISLQTDKKIIVLLNKKEDEKWDFLTKQKGLYKNNIRINWDKWDDSEAEDEDDVKNINIGGMGGMGGMGGGIEGMDMNMLQEMMGNMNKYQDREDGEDGEDGEDEEDGEGEGEGEE